MGLGQMFLVLLGIVLFSTLVIGVFNNMSMQVDSTANNLYYSQGLKIADMVFQKLEAQHISGAPFTALLDPVPADTLYFENTQYVVMLDSHYCDLYGEEDTIAEENHILVRCRIAITAYGGRKELVVGDDDAHFRKVYTNLGY